MSLMTTVAASASATATAITATTSGAPLTSLLLKPAGVTRIRCSDSSPTRRGFGAKKTGKVTNDEKDPLPSLQKRKFPLKESGPLPTQAPGLSSQYGGNYNTTTADLEFEERLKAVRRLAVEQKKADETREFGAIDYDAPTESKEKTIGIGTKIGAGVAVVVFGFVFAQGDFLPSVSDSPSEEALIVNKELPYKDKAILQNRLKQFEAALATSPKDPNALEGAAVTLAELGEYAKAASQLENLIKEKPNDPDVYRLLGEVKFELKDYEGSAAAYKNSSALLGNVNFEVLRDLTNALLAAKKPYEAVQVLMTSRDLLNSKKSDDVKAESNIMETETQIVDPVQIDLLLGKAYSEWGHVTDAISVYDRLITIHPDDFRGYLAKGILLKENGNAGDAERMFIQARFFAPEKAKALVDRYSRR